MDEQQEQPGSARNNLPSKRFVAFLYLPLMLPALLPIYLSQDQEDPVLVAIMVGTSIAILIANAFALILLYRWFASLASK